MYSVMDKRATFIATLLVVVVLSSKTAWSLHTVFCFRLPPPFDDAVYAKSGSSNPISIGMEKFPQDPKFWKKYMVSAHTPGDDGEGKTTGLANIATFSINVHTISGRTSGIEPLNGWYRIEISKKYPGKFDEYIRSFVFYAHDEQMNVVGQFVHDFPTSKKEFCPPNDATRYMIISCGGTYKSEPFPPNAVVYVRNKTALDGDHWPKAYQKYWPIVPEHVHSKMNFYFRYSFQDSSRPQTKFIIFRLIADFDENFDFYGKYGHTGITKPVIEKFLFSETAIIWFREKAVAGAIDPLPTQPEQLNCDNAMGQQLNTDHRTVNWQWYISRYANTAIVEKGISRAPLILAVMVPPYYGCHGMFFGGRCMESNCDYFDVSQGNKPDKKRQAASLNVIPQWDSTQDKICGCPSNLEFWTCFNRFPHDKPKEFNHQITRFYECKDHLKETLKNSKCPKSSNQKQENCTITASRKRRPPMQGGGGSSGNGNGNKNGNENGNENGNGNGNAGAGQDTHARAEVIKKIINQRGIRVYGMGTILYSVRKGHGVAMSIAVFCIPLLIFTSRYYKETFMSSRILYTRVWFQMHIQLVFWIFVFYFGGLLLAFSGRSLLGVSLTGAGVAHRIFGWLSIVLYVLIAITGGIRWFDDPGKSYTICIHWIFGWILYILNVITLLLSIEIPGSPISDHDDSVFDDQDEPLFNKAHIVILGWVLVDVIIHVIMTLSIYSYDRWMDVVEPRIFIPAKVGVPIPVLKESIQDDAAGSGFRILMFWLYVGILVLFCLGVCTIIISMSANPTKGFGPMTCTHDPETNQLLQKFDPSCLPDD